MVNGSADEDEEELTEIPERTKADVGHAVVKAVLSAIPVLGGPAAELFATVIQPPIERRRSE